ncbi:MAG: hypothetical protein AB8G23_24745 [Myxococcota bacterium]
MHAPKFSKRHFAGILSALVWVALLGCGAKPSAAQILGECTPTNERTFPNANASPSPHDMFFAVRLNESAGDVFALLSDHENMKEWISVIDESWVEEVTSEVPLFGGPPDLTRSWRIGEHVFSEDVRYWPPNTHSLLYSLNLERSKADLPLMKQLSALVVDSCLEGGSMLQWWQFFDEDSRTFGQSPTSSVPHLSVAQILDGLIRRFGGQRLYSTPSGIEP